MAAALGKKLDRVGLDKAESIVSADWSIDVRERSQSIQISDFAVLSLPAITLMIENMHHVPDTTRTTSR